MSVYFGTRIYGANENFLVTELNAFDKVYFDDIRLVPKLTWQAAVFTFPFVLGIVGLQIFVFIKSTIRQAKNIALGMLIASLIILIAAIITISNPAQFDFSKWGFIWICFGLIIIAGNALSAVINKQKS
jgi:hypothetical protein